LLWTESQNGVLDQYFLTIELENVTINSLQIYSYLHIHTATVTANPNHHSHSQKPKPTTYQNGPS